MPSRLRGRARYEALMPKRRRGALRERYRAGFPRQVSYKVSKFSRTTSIVLNWDEQRGLSYGGTISDTGLFSVAPTQYGQGLSMHFELSQCSLNFTNGSTVLMSLPNITELTALWDQYRVDAVHIKWVFTNNVAIVASGAQIGPWAMLPILMHCTDYDDAAPAANAQELLQRPETKLRRHGTVYTHTIRNPKFSVGVQLPGSTAQASVQTGWLDCAQPLVEHFGYKVWADNPTKTPASLFCLGFFNVYVTYDFSLKGVR